MATIAESFNEWLSLQEADKQQVERKNIQLQQDIDNLSTQLSEANKNLLDSMYESEKYKLQLSLPPKPKQRVGMNCALFSSLSYSDIDKVISCLSILGIKHIRVAFDYTSGTGKMLQHDKWLGIKPKLDAASIHVRAMVYLRGDDGFDAFNKFYLNYPYFNEIEIGNENAIRSIKSGLGTKPADYDLVQLQKDVTYITGAYKALLQYPVVPIISITWLHYYYNDMLRANGVNALLSVHSYSDGFENVGNQTGFKGLNAITAAKSKYGNMVFEIGETNYLPTEKNPYSDQTQVEKAIPLIKKITDSGLGFYLFQLFDTPERGGREAHMGLFNADGTAKPIVEELKDLLIP